MALSIKPQRPAEEDLALVWPWVQYRTFLWLQRDDEDMASQLGVVNQVFGAVFGGDYVIPSMPDDTVMQVVRPYLIDQAVRFGRAFKLCEEFEEALDAIIGEEFRVKGKWRDADGIDLGGYNLDGYNKDGYDENGRDEEGRDKAGYNEEGYDRDGFNRWSHKNLDGLTRQQVAAVKAEAQFGALMGDLVVSLDDEQRAALTKQLAKLAGV